MRKIRTDIYIISTLWISIFVSLWRSFNFDPFFIFGIVGLLIVTVCYRKFNDFSFSFLFFILFLSVFDIISFNHSLRLKFAIFNVPSSILFLILVFKQNKKIFELKDKWFSEDAEEIENQKLKRINIFKTQFQTLSTLELERKLADGNLVDEAKMAIIELLNVENN